MDSMGVPLMDIKFNKISSLLYSLVELDVHSMMVYDLVRLACLDQENLSIYLINTIAYIEYGIIYKTCNVMVAGRQERAFIAKGVVWNG
jgi:hypothetical protein